METRYENALVESLLLCAGHDPGGRRPRPLPPKIPRPKTGTRIAAGREERSTESRKLLEEVLMARLTRELALDERQTVLMVRHLAEFRDNMAALRRERMVLSRNLRQAVRESKDEEVIAKVLEEVVAHEAKAAEARREIIDFDGFELTTWQKAKLYLFIVDFESDMRRLLKQAQERRFGRGQKAEPPENSSEGGTERAAESETTESETGDADPETTPQAP